MKQSQGIIIVLKHFSEYLKINFLPSQNLSSVLLCPFDSPKFLFFKYFFVCVYFPVVLIFFSILMIIISLELTRINLDQNILWK